MRTGTYTLILALTIATPALAQSRSRVDDGFMLEIDGKSSGVIGKVSGGGVAAEVVTDNNDPDGLYLVKKHIGNVKYEDFTMQLGLSMGQPVKEWIQSSLNMNYMRKSGSIVASNFKRDSRIEREFHDALLTEIGFPACDGASKDPAYMSLKFAPEIVRHKKGTGKVDSSGVPSEQKQWLPSNFRVSLAGLDTSRVTEVDALTFKMKPTNEGDLQTRPSLEPTKLEFPNITLTIRESDAQSFLDYFEDFVISGNNSDGNEKSGSLVYLNLDMKSELARVNFSGCGIYRIAPQEGHAGFMQASFYCENFRVVLP